MLGSCKRGKPSLLYLACGSHVDTPLLRGWVCPQGQRPRASWIQSLEGSLWAQVGTLSQLCELLPLGRAWSKGPGQQGWDYREASGCHCQGYTRAGRLLPHPNFGPAGHGPLGWANQSRPTPLIWSHRGWNLFLPIRSDRGKVTEVDSLSCALHSFRVP